MRKPLLEIQEIDRYLFHQMTTAEKLLFQVRMIVSPELKGKVNAQLEVHEIIQWYGRKEKRGELIALHERLMRDENFRTSIQSIFKS